MSKAKQLEIDVILWLQRRHDVEQVTMPLLALGLKVTNDRIHGRQHYISQAIEKLRRRGLLEDVEVRCIHCTRAHRTRSRAVPLKLTQLGITFRVGDDLPAERTLREMTNLKFDKPLGDFVI